MSTGACPIGAGLWFYGLWQNILPNFPRGAERAAKKIIYEKTQSGQTSKLFEQNSSNFRVTRDSKMP